MCNPSLPPELEKDYFPETRVLRILKLEYTALVYMRNKKVLPQIVQKTFTSGTTGGTVTAWFYKKDRERDLLITIIKERLSGFYNNPFDYSNIFNNKHLDVQQQKELIGLFAIADYENRKTYRENWGDGKLGDRKHNAFYTYM
jgi:hypothetical protein